MPNNKSVDVLAGLLDFAEDHELSVDEAREELVLDGVDVSSLLARVHSRIDQVKKAERLQWQSDARRKQEQFRASRKMNVEQLGRAELLAKLAQVKARIPNAHAHYKRLEDLTDEDLRTTLSDLLWLDGQEGK